MLQVAAPGRAILRGSPYKDSDRDYRWEFTIMELLHRWSCIDLSGEVARLQLQVLFKPQSISVLNVNNKLAWCAQATRG